MHPSDDPQPTVSPFIEADPLYRFLGRDLARFMRVRRARRRPSSRTSAFRPTGRRPEGRRP